ncbi:mannose-6-phosphate isomerase [Sphingobacterium sp. SGG-5]|uniref:class I mannose-6-phosphate isomerase n=1 Tax=Sphingobacterium sp. SGG-5 TaxID=2710881 RepID=UPI0013EC5B6C|nr:class I mannose-6-phosphate isomerase [Sphingobacterium sp. SGG-5]NGM61089.1 mannose-6-phosphate isomerase [Sphingobacterium sp. SGG-5]
MQPQESSKHPISNYDKQPRVTIDGDTTASHEGWKNCCKAIAKKLDNIQKDKKVVVFECYHGVNDREIMPMLKSNFPGKFYHTPDYMHAEAHIQQLVYPDVTDDRVFGYITRLRMPDFFDETKVASVQKYINEQPSGVFYVYGPGASLIYPEADLLVYFDMPRWEIQQRFRRNEISNLGVENATLSAGLQYKQAFFVDWRVCDKWKKTLLHRIDFFVDTTHAQGPKLVSGDLFRQALEQVVTRPFRVVPFFDPGPWGGQWLKTHFDIDSDATNFAWGFDCVPEENSLLLDFNGILFETPAINLVFTQPRQLLGNAVQARFGDEFPIRFDLLDTMEGGNLSLQVHPTAAYIRENFGMTYTQEESYYLLDTGEDAYVYLGLNEGVAPQAMIEDLRESNLTGETFDVDKYARRWPVKKHDHISIPAGTVHCSCSNCMVLEISATPYIFTFKLWDWGQLGLDGKPRPINIDHGQHVIDWARQPDSTEKELINAIKPITNGDGWSEESTGLHERQFIETRRHWFSKPVLHHTNGSVNVLNLVAGREAIVESPTGAFAPFVVHYAETFIIPEQLKTYTIRPFGESEGKECATIKAYVRTGVYN